MSVSDPIADMLTRIRNAGMARHPSVGIPTSKMKLAIARILQDEGYIRDFELPGEGSREFRITLKYGPDKKPVMSGLKRVSKPGLRVYSGRATLPLVRGGLGVTIVSTSQGVMTGQEAWRRNLGGEVLCYIW